MSKREKLKLKNNPKGGELQSNSTRGNKKQSRGQDVTEFYPSNYIDLSVLSSPQLVIAFKGLQKRDPTTKEKSLDNLITYVNDPNSDMEDGLLAIWVQLYPQFTNEFSHRLRLLAHRLQGDIFKKFHKQSARYMRDIVGPWISGLYDNDKAVARAATQSFERVFMTDEKRKQVFIVFHREIVQFIKISLGGSIEYNTTDEKYFTEAEIQSRFARGIASAISMFSYLLSIIPPENIEEYQYDYAEIITSECIWKSIISQDTHLARVTLNLIMQLSYNYTNWLKSLKIYLRKYVVFNGLMNIAPGALIDYLGCLITISRLYPEVWNQHKESHGSSLSLLLKFVSEGSKYSGPRYWCLVQVLFENLPKNVLNPNDPSSFAIEDITSAFITGLATENKMSVDTSAEAYLSLLAYFISASESVEVGKMTIKKAISLGEEYILSSEPLGRRLNTETFSKIYANFMRKIILVNDVLVTTLWSFLYDTVISLLLDQQETSDVGTSRWISLSEKLGNFSADIIDRIGFGETINKMTRFCISSLQNGPQKAVMILSFLEKLLKSFHQYFNSSTKLALEQLISTYIPNMIMEKGSKSSIGVWIAYATAFQQNGQIVWNILADRLVNSDAGSKDMILIELLNSMQDIKNQLNPIDSIEQYILSKAISMYESSTQERDWDVVIHGLQGQGYIISEKASLTILNVLCESSLYDSDKEYILLKNLLILIQRNFSVLVSFIKSDKGNNFTPRLWQLSETGDDNASKYAKTILQHLEGHLSSGQSNKDADNTLFESLAGGILQEVEFNFEVGIESLVSRALSLYERSSGDSKEFVASQLLFDISKCEQILQAILPKILTTSLATVNNVGDAIYLVDEISFSSDKITQEEAIRSFRIALYICLFSERCNILCNTSLSHQLRVFTFLQIISEVSKDFISMNYYTLSPLLNPMKADTDLSEIASSGSDDLLLLTERTNHALNECCADFVLNDIPDGSFGHLLLLKDELNFEDDATDKNFMKNFVRCLSKKTRLKSPDGFYASRVLSNFIGILSEKSDLTAKSVELFVQTQKLRQSGDLLASVAIFEGLSKFKTQIQAFDRLRNELASDLIGVKLNIFEREALHKIILLNSLLSHIDDKEFKPFPPQRTIMLLKKLLDASTNEFVNLESNISLRTVLSDLLLNILPTVSLLYGEHWSKTMEFVRSSFEICADNYESEHITPLLYYSLKVFNLFKSLKEENEDVFDVLVEETDAPKLLGRMLTESLKISNRSEAQLQCDTLLSRQILDITSDNIDDSESLLSVISVNSESIQKAILILQERIIPKLQESLVIEAALDKYEVLTIELPAELLSLIMSLPDSYEDQGIIDFKSGMDYGTRAYLYAWKLVFEYFEHSSFKIRSKYIESLKEGDYVDSLLNFIFDIFEVEKGTKYIDPSKFDIERYAVNEESGEQEMKWLLLHIYYLALRHTPSICRKWWSEIRNRQSSVAVENFTQKFFSPILINEELGSVQRKLTEENVDAQDDNMQVKVSKATKEVAAVYTIDEQTMEMVIHVPVCFPLKDVHVDGVRRVGVKENQWRAWLLASQSVITSQNGTIVDALILFKRNVSLHFEGVTECAICYSILHQDRSLPNKKCQTCKNKFHAGCLYKWFQSANSSSCPLCRQPFSYGR
ncbi:hypothetical protein V1511DRAFT_289352 [Dipodascopsis uninucleata]